MVNSTLLDNREDPFKGKKMKKVIKAAEADKKVEAMIKKDEPGKTRSAKEVRNKLYGAKE